MLRLIVAICYGMALLLTILSAIGLVVVERGRVVVVAGWAVCVALLFAIGRLADIARDD